RRPNSVSNDSSRPKYRLAASRVVRSSNSTRKSRSLRAGLNVPLAAEPKSSSVRTRNSWHSFRSSADRSATNAGGERMHPNLPRRRVVGNVTVVADVIDSLQGPHRLTLAADQFRLTMCCADGPHHEHR